MALHIIVTAKQVIDPEMPISAYSIDAGGPRVVTPATFQPVINGFDENALEAALRLKDSQGATLTVEGSGDSFTVNGSASVVCGDIHTDNATVYVIDEVLHPPA